MLKMKKIIGVLLGACFLLSVTAATVNAAPYGYNHEGNKKFDDHYGNKWFDNHHGNKWFDNHHGNKWFDDYHGKKYKHFNPGYWGHKKIKHYRDRFHKFFWYSYERYWISSYWSYE
jgi:hypothetical protein